MRAFWDPAQLAHMPRFFLQRGVVRDNLEVPARALALLEGCRAQGFAVTAPPPATRAAIEAVHDAGYLDFLRDGPAEWAAMDGAGAEMVANIHPATDMLATGGRAGASLIGRLGWYTADTACPIGPATYAAALAAASCAVAAADAAARDGAAYALCRPPGHHAYAARAGGHCYLNNAAIAVEAFRRQGAAKVAVLDLDAHHGNGTQGIFWDRGDVLFASVHGDPDGYYPWYVGHADERGAGDGEGCTLNLPLPRGAADAAWLAALDVALAAIGRFGADALVVSLGFDASVDEPLRFLAVTDDGFAAAGAAIRALRLSTAYVQEGGYDLAALARLLVRFFSG